MTESARDKQTGSSLFCCPVVELRQYTLHSGKRDVLIDLFDREFVETQEEVGIKIIGQFRDLDHQDRFVWLRGFPDMTSRAKALNDFYSGPVWKAHREAANVTMIDSDNVLLLCPAFPTSGFSLRDLKRAPVKADEIPTSLVVATIYYFAGPVAPDFIHFFEHIFRPVTESLGATISASFVTESSENTFPALAAYENYLAALSRSERWRSEVSTPLTRFLERAPEVLRLSPTARSQLRCPSLTASDI